MRVAAGALFALLVLSAGAGNAATGGDVKGSMHCSGRVCTLTVTNTSGKAMASLSFVWQSSVKLSTATDPQAKSQNVAGTGGKITPLPAGQCAVFSGNNGSCSYSPTPVNPGWSNGQTHTVTLTAAANVPAGTKVAACPQGPSGPTSCTDIGTGSSSATTTTTPRVGSDLSSIVSGPDTVDLGTRSVRLHYEVDVINVGSVRSGGGDLYITADLLSGSEAVHSLKVVEENTTVSPACPHHEHGFICHLPPLSPKQKKSYTVSISYPSKLIPKKPSWFRVGTHLEFLDPGDPFPNNTDKQETHIRLP